MQGKIRKIKDTTTGTYIMPVTHAEAVYVSESTTLAQQLTSIGGGSKWKGKVWSMLGDSMTMLNTGYATIPYYDYISTKIGGITLNNYAYNGTGYFNDFAGSTVNAFHDKVAGMSSTADLITVFGGTNDWNETNKPFVMGTFGDTDPQATFYGAVDSTLTQLIAKFPTKTIAVITSPPRNNSWGVNSAGVTLEQVTDAVIKVANKYSIPVLDLYRKSNFYPWDAGFRTAVMPDGLHPNNTGHAAMGEKILAFINSL